jgi:hypothetical protein
MVFLPRPGLSDTQSAQYLDQLGSRRSPRHHAVLHLERTRPRQRPTRRPTRNGCPHLRQPAARRPTTAALVRRPPPQTARHSTDQMSDDYDDEDEPGGLWDPDAFAHRRRQRGPRYTSSPRRPRRTGSIDESMRPTSRRKSISTRSYVSSNSGPPATATCPGEALRRARWSAARRRLESSPASLRSSQSRTALCAHPNALICLRQPRVLQRSSRWTANTRPRQERSHPPTRQSTRCVGPGPAHRTPRTSAARSTTRRTARPLPRITRRPPRAQTHEPPAPPPPSAELQRLRPTARCRSRAPARNSASRAEHQRRAPPNRGAPFTRQPRVLAGAGSRAFRCARLRSRERAAAQSPASPMSRRRAPPLAPRKR